jgi:hypothetical protein
MATGQPVQPAICHFHIRRTKEFSATISKQFIDEVRKGCYPVVEGVIAKGDGFMVKIKTDAYFKRLNDVYGTQYRLYWE